MPRIYLPGEGLVLCRQPVERLLVDVLDGVPCVPSHHAVHRQAIDALKGQHRVPQFVVEHVGDADGRQLRQEKAQKRQIEPDGLDADACVAPPQHLGKLPLGFGEGQPLAGDLRQALDPVVDGLDAIPCALAHNAVLRQVEDPLEGADGGGGVRAEDAVGLSDGGESRVVLADAVQLPLDGADVLAHAAHGQRPSGIGGRAVPHRCVVHKVDVLPIVVLQYLVGRPSLLRQLLAAPLRQPPALGAHAIAELGVQRLHVTPADDVVVEHIVHDGVDVLERLLIGGECLIVLGVVGDVEVIAPAAVELRIDPVQRHGYLRQHVGADGALVPCGVYLAGGHALDIAGKGDGDVLRRGVRRAQMDGDVLRNNRIGHGSALLSLRRQRHRQHGLNTGKHQHLLVIRTVVVRVAHRHGIGRSADARRVR